MGMLKEQIVEKMAAIIDSIQDGEPSNAPVSSFESALSLESLDSSFAMAAAESSRSVTRKGRNFIVARFGDGFVANSMSRKSCWICEGQRTGADAER